MGESVVPFLCYDDTKASIAEAKATTTKRQYRVHLPCIICDKACGIDTIKCSY